MDQSSRSTQTSNHLVSLLLSQIEKKLGWGDSSKWTGSDFEILSDKILSATDERLSVTTLKRTWGRTSQSVSPSVTTLNILAQYNGESSWRDFSASNDHHQSEQPQNVSHAIGPTKRFAWLGLTAMMLLALVFYGLTWGNHPNEEVVDIPESLRTEAEIDESKISFSIEKVTQGIPNTVIFRYDLGGQEVKSAELQQTWDNSKRIELDPTKSLVTTTYMKPGYFNAKLVVNGEIVRSENLYLPSNGFDAMISLKGEEETKFLPSGFWDIDSEGFSLSEKFDEKYEQETIEDIVLLNLLPSPEIGSENFTLHSRFFLEQSESADPCYPVMLIITGPEQVYLFSMGHIGCSGKFYGLLGGYRVDGKTHDLSAMGLPVSEQVDLTIIKEGNSMNISVNGSQLNLPDKVPSIGKIGGFRLFSSHKIAMSKMTIEDEVKSFDFLHTKPHLGSAYKN